jgi:aminoglycoside phosphotransferase (APT) family kinase protein
MTSPQALPVLADLLPVGVVGSTIAIEPIVTGQSGAQIYGVRTTRGELVLRVAPQCEVAEHWANELRVLRRAAECGVAPRILHIDEAARATVSVRVAETPLVTVLADPDVRSAVAASMAAQVRTLHALDPAGIEERDPLHYARARFVEQRLRPGFPAWADGLEPILAGIESTLARDPRRVVSHNDLNLGNVMWDGTRAWLIDWGQAGLAHPFYDLAVMALCLQLDDATAHGLLALEQGRQRGELSRSLDLSERETFAAARRLAMLFYGIVNGGLVPDLGILPASPPSVAFCYAERYAGKLSLHDVHGRATFAAALLRAGIAP